MTAVKSVPAPPRSRFEANVCRQPALVRAALSAPAPAWFKPPRGRKIFLVGVGTNHHAARIAAWLWSRAGLDARAVHSHDFVSRPYRLGPGDLGVFLSHRGSRSYTVQAEAAARRAGAETVIVTAEGSAWKAPRRLTSGPLEDTGAFTQSFTTTLAWLLRWPARPALLAPFARMENSLRWGPAFPEIRPDADVVLIGDGLREWIACEIALKLQETAHARARAFGLEEFLHGPCVSVGAGSVVIGFTSAREPRWNAARGYLAEIEVPFVEARSEDWLAQILWGQRLTIAACRGLGIDPDLLRGDDPRYVAARERLRFAPAR
jgi:glucosamine--fructose-6-phosphate aminotransferase (isomerizing)